MAHTTEPATRAEHTTDIERASALLGIVSPVIALGAILTATLLAPEFSWSANALSDLGRPAWPSTGVFNGGLILGGVVALPFSLPLARASRNVAHWLATVAFVIAAVALALIGVFSLPTPQHGTVAITFFLAFTVVLLVRGIGDYSAGAHTRGLTTVTGYRFSWSLPVIPACLTGSAEITRQKFSNRLTTAG